MVLDSKTLKAKPKKTLLFPLTKSRFFPVVCVPNVGFLSKGLGMTRRGRGPAVPPVGVCLFTSVTCRKCEADVLKQRKHRLDKLRLGESVDFLMPCPQVNGYFYERSFLCAVWPLVHADFRSVKPEHLENSAQREDFQRTMLFPISDIIFLIRRLWDFVT